MNKFPHVPLGELMARKSGSVDPTKFPEEVFDLYSIPAFDKGRPEIATGASIGSAKQIVRPKDVLLSKIVPHIRRAWVVEAERGRRLIASGEWIVFRSEKIDPDYVRNFVISDPFHAQFMSTVSGVGGSLLRARPAQVADIEIPVPPLPEQRRIAAILDQADALRTKRREALAELDKLTQAIFVEMFGDPAVNPKNWPLKALGSISSKFSDGPFGSNLKSEHYVESGVRVIRLQNIGVGQFIDKDKAYISSKHFLSIKKHECLPGDVLVGTMGDPNLRACMLPETISLAVNKADCVQIRVDKNKANPIFICDLINNPSAELLAQDLKRGQTRVRISMGSLRGLKLPIPPVDLQNKYAEKLTKVAEQRIFNLRSLEENGALFASLHHRAFRGEL